MPPSSPARRLARPALRLVAAMLALFASPLTWARPPVEPPDNLLSDRFALTANFIMSSTSTDLRLDPSAVSSPGTPLNAESDLGLKKRKLLGLGEVMFRIRDRHKVRMQYYFVPLDRSGHAVLAHDIQFKNAVFRAGETVTSELKMQMFAFDYSYAVLRSERYELGLSFGFDAIEFSAKGSVPARFVSQTEDRSGPAPLIGMDGALRLSSRWYADSRIQYLKVHLSDVRGSLKSWDLNAMYRYSRNVTFGIGLTHFDVSGSSNNLGNSGSFSLKTDGPKLFFRASL